MHSHTKFTLFKLKIEIHISQFEYYFYPNKPLKNADRLIDNAIQGLNWVHNPYDKKLSIENLLL